MLRRIDNLRIIFAFFIVASFLVTTTFAYAVSAITPEKVSNVINKEVVDDFVEKDLSLVSYLDKQVVNSRKNLKYNLKIVDGNVLLYNEKTNKSKTVYNKGNAKYLAEVNLYYYDTSYILLITDNGELYVNIYKSNEEKVKFRKINMKDTVTGLKVIEREINQYYEHPSVELYAVNPAGDRELIKL